MTVAFLDVENGKRVYYEHHSGTGRPVVLVHGWAASAHAWDSTVPVLLAQGHSVTVIEHRGCGRSDKDFDDVSIAAIASDVVALVRHLGLSRPVLNGWSLGGAVVVEAARQLGDDVGGLVLTGGATPRYTQTDDWPHGAKPEDVEGVLAGLSADRAGTFRAVADAVCAKPVSAATVESMWLDFLATGPTVGTTMRGLIDLDQRDVLGSLLCPVLLLCGNQDAFVAFDGVAASKDLYRDARLVEFDGVGHAPFVEDPETYRAELTTFLAGLS